MQATCMYCKEDEAKHEWISAYSEGDGLCCECYKDEVAADPYNELKPCTHKHNPLAD